MSAIRAQSSTWLFVALVWGVVFASIYLSRMVVGLQHPEVLAIAIALDLVVVIPAAFYLLVVRPRRLPVVTLAPVLILSLVMAHLIVPSEHEHLVRALGSIIIPIELGLVGWVGWQAIQTVRDAGRSGADALEAIRRSVRARIPQPRAAEMVSSELALFFYLVTGWRDSGDRSADARSFTHHIRSGHAAIVVALLMATGVEVLAVHLLLALWSTTAAWIVTALSIYGALWLVADYRATARRPLAVDDDELIIRAGLRWTVRVARTNIASIERKPPEHHELLPIPFAASSTIWLVLEQPVEAQGPYGFSKNVTAIGLAPDEPDAFLRALDTEPF